MPSIGKISGLCADYSQATLNGRPYDKIYERILSGNDFRFNEMMKRGGIPCELGHPIEFDPKGTPRTEPDPTKIAVILTKVERSGPQQLSASGEIMDTPNGRIFKTLSEFYDFGLSSRGSYEVDENSFSDEGPDGWNQDSYIFKGYDLVLLPANQKSVLSVTESMDKANGKVIKVARESIDVNLLAKASKVSEDEVNKALDDLFKTDPEAKKDKEISISDMKENLEQNSGLGIGESGDGTIPTTEGQNLDQSDFDRLLSEEEEAVKSYQSSIDKFRAEGNEGVASVLEHIKSEETEHIEELNKLKNGDISSIELDKSTSIINDEDVNKIKADLETALNQVSELKQGREKDGVELSNRNAELTKLTQDRDDLKSELDEKIAESEELEQKFEALKDMASKLLESYKAAKAKFDSKPIEDNSAEEELKSKVEEMEKREKEATECYNREKLISKQLRTELLAAKESLIKNNAMALGISENSLRNSLGKSFKVKDIRPAAESLANQVVGYPIIPNFSVSKKRSSSTENLYFSDEVEKEIYDQIKNNS